MRMLGGGCGAAAARLARAAAADICRKRLRARRGVFISLASVALKQELQRELNLARRVTAADGAEARAGAVAVGGGEVGVVERIKHLGAELQLHSFARQAEVLEDTEIERVQR